MFFHPKCGQKVILSENNTRATRRKSEFDHGLCLSANPLQDDKLFEIRIVEKVSVWAWQGALCQM